MAALSHRLQQYTKLEHRLVLLAWLNSLLCYDSTKEMLTDIKDVAEGFDASGFSFIYYHLIARPAAPDHADPGHCPVRPGADPHQ
jgi:hypothetical protein